MVKIRLRKVGMRHQPSYRIVAIESRRPRDGEYLEALGHFDPRRKHLEMNLERVEYWLSKGARPSDTTRKLIRRYAGEHRPAAEAPAEPEAAPAAEPAEPVETAVTSEPTPTEDSEQNQAGRTTPEGGTDERAG